MFGTGTGIGSAFYLLAATLQRDPAGTHYWTYFKWWFALDVPAFFALVAVFWLMVEKSV